MMQAILHGDHKMVLPHSLVDRGLVYRGASWRLRKFVTKLIEGDQVSCMTHHGYPYMLACWHECMTPPPCVHAQC